MMIKAFLIVFVVTTSYGTYEQRYEFEDIGYCHAALKQMRIEAPDGGDQEGTVVAFCVLEDKGFKS